MLSKAFDISSKVEPQPPFAAKICKENKEPRGRDNFKDKYTSTFSHEIEVIVYVIPQIYFNTLCAFMAPNPIMFLFQFDLDSYKVSSAGSQFLFLSAINFLFEKNFFQTDKRKTVLCTQICCFQSCGSSSLFYFPSREKTCHQERKGFAV